MRLTFVAAIAIAVLSAPSSAWAGDNISFGVSVLMSAKAGKEMAFTGQQLKINAVYYGTPNRASVRKADNMGHIYLGEDSAVLPGEGGITVLKGNGFKRENLRLIDGSPKVNVNVFSVRGGKPNNILDCEIIDGNVPREMRELHCKLIGER